MRKPVVAGSSGLGVGVLVVFGAGLLGLPLTPEVGAIVGGLVTGAAAAVASKGVRGIVRQLWRGSGEAA